MIRLSSELGVLETSEMLAGAFNAERADAVLLPLHQAAYAYAALIDYERMLDNVVALLRALDQGEVATSLSRKLTEMGLRVAHSHGEG